MTGALFLGIVIGAGIGPLVGIMLDRALIRRRRREVTRR